MPGLPEIYADFHNADSQGRVRLNCVGTVNDLSRQQVQLREGLDVLLYSDDADSSGNATRLVAEGEVVYSQDEQCWVATIDWQQIRREASNSATRREVDAISDFMQQMATREKDGGSITPAALPPTAARGGSAQTSLE